MASILACLLVCLSVCLCASGEFLNQFAVQFDGDRQEMEAVAKSMGFEFRQELKHTKVFILTHSGVEHRSKRSAVTHVDRLNAHPKILSAEQEVLLDRVKREIIHDKQLEMPIREIKDNSVFHRVKEARLSARSDNSENVVLFLDPLFHDQWVLRNYGQTGGKIGMDLNVDPAWSRGITGAGVVISILDDGIDHTHLDLVANYDSDASADLNDPDDIDNDPMPDMSTPENEEKNNHGTHCAGVIASGAQNDWCGVGVAFDAKIGGIRLLDGTVTDHLEAEALTYNLQHIHILSASWGPRDNGRCMEGPGKKAANALKKGVREGRNGLGTLYVWANGNGGMYGDDCGADGYVACIETLAFGSVTDHGMPPYFTERCTSTLAVVPSGGEVVVGEEEALNITRIKTVTTDVKNGCIENFVGTSSAAPIAAGAIALVLQENPNLTWRDCQHIVVHSSRIPSVDHSWIINGAGLHVSHTFGFGVIDASRMVELAGNWTNVPEQHECVLNRKHVNKIIPNNGEIVDSVEMDGCKGQNNRIHNLEHVQVKIKLEHTRRGDVQLFLVCPSNTWSEILSPRPFDKSDKGIDFTFMTVHCWSENPEGSWSLHVIDSQHRQARNNTGMLLEWTLILYGTAGPQVNQMGIKAKGKAHFPNLVEVRSVMDKEDLRTDLAKIDPVKKKKGLDKETANSKLVQNLINALKKSPHINSENRKLENIKSSPKINKFSDLFLRGLETNKHLTGRKSSSGLISKSDRKLEDDLIDALVRELKSEEEVQKRKEEEKRKAEEEQKRKAEEERELDSLVGQLEKKLSEKWQNVQKAREDPVSLEKKEENLLQQLLLAVKKEVRDDPQKIHEVEKKISSRQEESEKKVLEEVRKVLEEEGRKGSKREEDVASLAENRKSIKREELSIRTLADLLDYVKEGN